MIADKVKTTQIAVTVLTVLGLDPAALQGAKAEQTAALAWQRPITVSSAGFLELTLRVGLFL